MSPRNRGKPKKKLRDLSREHPTTEDFEKIVETLIGTPDPIVRAILGQSVVEVELDNLIRPRLRHRDDDTWIALTDNNGPLGTFYSKILFGHALGIYNEVIRDNLNTVRKIRNVFAHAKKPITFSNEVIVQELTALRRPNGTRTKLYKDLSLIQKVAGPPINEPDTAYSGLCWSITNQLLKKQNERLSAKARRLKKKQTQRSRYGGLLFGDIFRDPTSPQATSLRGLSGTQLFGPTTPPPSQGPPPPFDQAPTPPRKKGK